MSKASHLFYSTDKDKKTLHRAITPSDVQQEIQQERWQSLRDWLAPDLNEATGYSVSSWLQGSYKYHTQIRPASKFQESDIDLGLYLEWDGAPGDGAYSPKELKDLVQESLKAYAAESENVKEVVEPAKTRCARIRFKNGFHIDVPVYHLNPATGKCMLATEDDEWEDSDPETLYNWFLDKYPEEGGGKVRRLIRYLKMWSALHIAEPKRPSSTMLSVLVAEAFPILNDEETDGDENALRNVIEEILERLSADRMVRNPVNYSEDLNRLSDEDFDSFYEKLEELLANADKALASANEFEASSHWTEAFHHFFPIPDPKEAASKALIPVRFVPQVAVRAVADNNASYVVNGVNRIGPILRGCTITFTVSNAHELPAGSTIDWVVRNDSEESDFENDLGHIATGLGHTWHENSAYKGTHFMDMTARHPVFGILGFVRIPVDITGTFMVPRNPPKPKWTRLRRRR